MNVEKIALIAKTIKEADLSGFYMIGTIEGVDFSTKGKGQINGQDVEWDTAIKLKFVTKIDTIKTINGIDVPTQKLVSNIIKLPCNDDQVPTLVAKYNKLIGKQVIAPIQTSDNSSFKTLETNIHELSI